MDSASDRPAGKQRTPDRSASAVLHPAWCAFIQYCRDLRHGEIERLVIQDGMPVLAEVTKKKVKFPQQ